MTDNTEFNSLCVWMLRDHTILCGESCSVNSRYCEKHTAIRNIYPEREPLTEKRIIQIWGRLCWNCLKRTQDPPPCGKYLLYCKEHHTIIEPIVYPDTLRRRKM